MGLEYGVGLPLLAGMLETAWAVGLKYSEGLTRLWPSVYTLITMGGSIWLLSLAMRTLPMGPAYAVWTGIGAVGTAVIGLVAFGEPRTAARLVCLGIILAGIVGLKWASE